jgi:hypothetical protein
MMTKKEYKKFAEMFKREKIELSKYADAISDSCQLELERIIGEVAYIFATDNPYFDRDKFFEACGLEV